MVSDLSGRFGFRPERFAQAAAAHGGVTTDEGVLTSMERLVRREAADRWREADPTLLAEIEPIAVVERIWQGQTAMGVVGGELSWILEDNLPMRRMIEQFGGVAYKTYRIYERGLA